LKSEVKASLKAHLFFLGGKLLKDNYFFHPGLLAKLDFRHLVLLFKKQYGGRERNSIHTKCRKIWL
jgi:hypothetical protein